MKKGISIFLILSFILSLGAGFPMEVSAAGATDPFTATAQGEYTAKVETQNITILIELPGITAPYTSFGIDDGIIEMPDGFQFVGYSTSNTTKPLVLGSDYFINTGHLSYQSASFKDDIPAETTYAAVFSAPANASGDFEIVFGLPCVANERGDYVAQMEKLSASFTISEPSAPPVEPTDYELYYTLDGTAADVLGTDGAAGTDKYHEYGINDTITATVKIKNKTNTAVSLQAYDIYLTHDSKLTPGTTFSLNDGENYPVTVKKTDGGLHIQAIGSNTSAGDDGVVEADININLPANGEATLGTLTFTFNSAAAYDEELHITLTDNSVTKSEGSTNIGIADYVEGSTTTGNKSSYYPSVACDVLGAEVNTTYTVTYDANNGTWGEGAANPTQEKQHNVNLTLTPGKEPTRTGYTFVGWSTESGDDNAANEVIAYSDNEAKTFYAVWQKDTVTITWMNGETQYGEKDEIEYNTIPTAPTTNPSKDKTAQYTYTFLGWSTNPNASAGETLTAVTEDTIYHAIYSATTNKYTVTWYNYDETQLHKDEEVPYGTTPDYDGQIPTKPDSTDGQFEYTHDGWSASKDGAKLETLPAVDGNEVYYAVFKEITKSYTVNYAAGTGSFADGTTTRETVPFGQTPQQAPTPTALGGYSFSGWSDGITTYKTDLSDYTVKGAATLTAQYTPDTYTITLNPDGGTVAGMTVNAESNYTIEYDITSAKTLPTATKTGYAFDGWKLESTVDGWEANTYGANTSVTGKWGDVTLVAQWSEDKHEVKQSANVENGTATPDVNSAKEGDTVTVTVTPAEGYKFVVDTNTVNYTYTDAEGTQHTGTINVTDTDGNGIYTGTFDMPDYAVEITATFTAIDYTITVTVTPSGYATVTPSKATAHVNDEITLTASNIKDGYQLNDYMVINASTQDEIVDTNGVFTMPAANVTVTATFEGKSYEITYDSNGGENSMSATKGTFGTATTLTANAFAKTGYTFAGWTTTEGGTTVEYVDNTNFNPETYAESYKLYAVWTAKEVEYTVNYWLQNIGGGTEHDNTNFTNQEADKVTRTATADSVISVAPEKDYTGFTTPSAETNVKINPDDTTVVDFYYTRNSYTITFKDGENTLTDLTITKQYGDTVTAPKNPTKNGYSFKEWTPVVPNTMPATNTNISATWDLVTYNITYKDGDNVLTGLNPATYTIVSTDKLPTYSKTNYIFKGWKVTETVENSTVWAKDAVFSAGTETSVTGKYGDVTLTAVWEEAITYTVDDYKYAQTGYKMLRIADTLASGKEYKFNNVSMYYMDGNVGEKYLLNPSDTGVFYYLIESEYVGADNKLTEDGMKLITSPDAANRATITYNGKINDDDIVNIADANIVYQMIVNGGGYYSGANDLTIEQRLAADMNKEAADASVQRATIDDVHRIVGIINGTATTN